MKRALSVMAVTALSLLVEAFWLGRTFEVHQQIQPDENQYDGLCEYVARETERLHRRMLALLQNRQPSREYIFVERAGSVPVRQEEVRNYE